MFELITQIGSKNRVSIDDIAAILDEGLFFRNGPLLGNIKAPTSDTVGLRPRKREGCNNPF